MMEKILYRTKYLSLVEKDNWIFVKDMTEAFVAILPFRDREGEIEFLARIETIPAHQPARHLCALTGTIEKGESPSETARRELYEESGFRGRGPLIQMGQIFLSKSSSTVVHLYAIEVTDEVQEEAPGDGTQNEEEATTKWLTRKKASMVPDSLFCAMITRLSLWFEQHIGN